MEKIAQITWEFLVITGISVVTYRRPLDCVGKLAWCLMTQLTRQQILAARTAIAAWYAVSDTTASAVLIRFLIDRGLSGDTLAYAIGVLSEQMSRQ